MLKKATFMTVCLTSLMAFCVPPQMADLAQIQRQLDEQKQLERRSKAQSQAVSAEMKRVQKQLVQDAKKVQNQEEKLQNLEDELHALQEKENTVMTRLGLTQEQLGALMIALQRMALHPKEVSFFRMEGPVQYERSQMLLRFAFPKTYQQKTALQKELDTLFKTKSAIEAQKKKITQANQQLEEKNTKMTALLAEKARLQKKYDASQKQAQKRVEQLAAQAKTLKELLDKIAAEQQKSSQHVVGSGAFAKAYGALVPPVAGAHVVQAFGSSTISGARFKGMRLQTRPQAVVVAPFDGVVKFAGYFKGYEQTVIIDHGDQYMTLLSGMGGLDVQLDQVVVAGEPIGRMGNTSNFYMELRHKSEAVNPAPWLATS